MASASAGVFLEENEFHKNIGKDGEPGRQEEPPQGRNEGRRHQQRTSPGLAAVPGREHRGRLNVNKPQGHEKSGNLFCVLTAKTPHFKGLGAPQTIEGAARQEHNSAGHE